jgi:hypothetical protein
MGSSEGLGIMPPTGRTAEELLEDFVRAQTATRKRTPTERTFLTWFEIIVGLAVVVLCVVTVWSTGVFRDEIHKQNTQLDKIHRANVQRDRINGVNICRDLQVDAPGADCIPPDAGE